MLSAQLCAFGWTGVLAYLQAVAMGVNLLGCFLQDNPKLRIVRQIGLIFCSLLGFMAIWTVIGHNWCGHFYYANIFS